MNERGPDSDDLGQLERVGGQVLVTFRRWFPRPPSTVWRAVTEPEHLAAWFPTTIEGSRVAGAKLLFRLPDTDAPAFEGEMLVFEPPSVVELRWGDELLQFRLEPRDNGTLLVFTASFDELGKVARDGAGWHACLDLLGCVVVGEIAPWSSADRWKQVHRSYVERFGPEASTVGPPEG